MPLDIIGPNEQATSGPLKGLSLWSNDQNWTSGVPVNGDAIDDAAHTSDDDLDSLSLDTLNLNGNINSRAVSLQVSGRSLTIATLTTTAAIGGLLDATAFPELGPVTVTIDTIGTAGITVEATGTGAKVVVQTAVAQTENFGVQNGGDVEVVVTPASVWNFNYDPASVGTFAFDNPASSNAISLNHVRAGDVLELPGTSVSSVTYGPNSLSVTTSAGVYAFTDVSYDDVLRSYTAALDPATGLVAITFADQDVFTPSITATPLSPEYPWSNAANWAGGVPSNGAAVSAGATGYDDLAALSLSSLVFNEAGAAADVYVTGTSLTIADIEQSGAGGSAMLEADATDGGHPVTVTVQKANVQGANFEATGPGAKLLDQAETDLAANDYDVANGGLVELSNAPYAGDIFSFNSNGTLAFKNPGAVVSSLILGVSYGDTFEVPGTMVSSVSFGASSLTVTTDAGIYDFNSLVYGLASQISGYTAAADPTTGLEAITLTGPDKIHYKTSVTGTYWSDPTNWSRGLPVNGDNVLNAVPGTIDDIPVLSLNSLNVSPNENYESAVHVTGTLTVGTLYSFPGGTLAAYAPAAGSQATVTVGATVDPFSIPQFIGDISNLDAVGAGGILIDQATIDPGTNFAVYSGGTIEITSETPSDHSLLQYDPLGTFALFHPAAASAVRLLDVSPHDVLELPGTSVSNITFGTNSLSVTTDAGFYSFSDVRYVPSKPITGYTAAVDPKTGLEAITFTGPDTFEQNVKATSGAFAGKYLWSNAANWSNGVPIDGDSAAVADPAATGYDDLAALVLTSLGLNGSDVFVTGNSLTVGAVTGGGHAAADGTLYSGSLRADALDSGAPVTVTVGTITDSFATLPDKYLAVGTSARFIDQSAVDAGEDYIARQGGLLELDAAPAGTSRFFYSTADNGSLVPGIGVFAFANPGATITAALSGVAPGDVLELPGTAVSAAAFGADSLRVTSDTGSYDFTNVNYLNPVTGYTAAADPFTGLEAITLTGPDVFEQNVKATVGPLAGKYLWSNPANWSNGVPVDSGSVAVADQAATGYDDLAALTLNGLSLNGSDIFVTGNSLTVGAVTGGGHKAADGTLYAGTLHADALDADAPVTVTVGTITDSFATFPDQYQAVGVGARFIDQSAVDAGEDYIARQGGLLELDAAPAGTSRFLYSTADNGALAPGIGLLALANPGATVTAGLDGVAPGDVLELPGTSVSNVTFEATSMSVTTDAGIYTFTNVSYLSPANGYTAAVDPTTGLEAITFTDTDVFEENIEGPNGYYLWSNPANWSQGLPADGDSVLVPGFLASNIVVDDVAALTLSTLTIEGDGQFYAIGASLDIAKLSTVSGYQFIAGVLTHSPVTVTLGSVTAANDDIAAQGSNSRIIDLSTTDPGEFYIIAGGLLELAAAPSSASVLQYEGEAGGTLALDHPGATNAARLTLVLPGDVLEVPGTKVLAVPLGANNFTVLTDAGSYTFSNVTYASPVTGVTSARDATTGLVAVTFTHDNHFVPNVAAAGGDFLWSNAGNWSSGAPADGDSISLDPGTVTDDDLGSLSLTTLTLTDNTQVTVTAGALTVKSVAGSADVTRLFADTTAAGPATVTVDAITGTGGEYGAIGTGARFVDLSSSDPGETYRAEDGGVVELSAPPDASSVLAYSGAGTFEFDAPGATIAAALENLAPGDVLELPGKVIDNVTYGADSISVTTDDGTYLFSDVDFSSPASGYTAAFDSNTGLEAVTVACYLKGTRILTDTGEVAVEDLAIGDRVITSRGVARPIRWIGTRGYSGRFTLGQNHILPICIKASALDENVPRRDLWISPHHAMYLEGVLIEARDLVNDVSIVQAGHVEAIEYFHIELESHDVIVAEGALSESFVDDDSRGIFHNAHTYRALYPNSAEAPARYFAPRRSDGYAFEAARRYIDARAGLRSGDERPSLALRGYIDDIGPRRIAGWAQTIPHPEAPVCLDILVDGRLIGQSLANHYREDLAVAGLGSGRHGFEFTPPAGLAIIQNMVEVRRSFDAAPLGFSRRRSAPAY